MNTLVIISIAQQPERFMASRFVFSFLALSLLSIFANGLFANEISYVEHGVWTGTNRYDVKGLAALQSKFILLQSWSGDPCTGFLSWSWVLCTSDPTPRITALYLSSYVLTGTLPDFSYMDALETIDLSNNYLTGSIPDFLGTLPNLQELNLENNDFRGTIPSSLAKNPNLTLMVTGNANLCASDKSCKNSNKDNTPFTSSYTPYGGEEKKKKNKLAIVLGILIPIFILFWIVVGFIAISHHKRKSAAVAAMVQATSNIPEMKGQEGEITTVSHMEYQQNNTYTNEKEHVDVPHQQHANP